MTLKPEAMKKASIICKTVDVKRLTSALHDLKAVHFERVSEERLGGFTDFTAPTEQLLAVRATIDIFRQHLPENASLEPQKSASLEDVAGRAATLYQELKDSQRRITNLEDDARRKEVQERLGATKKDLDGTTGYVKPNRAVKKELKKRSYKTVTIGKRTYFLTKKRPPFPYTSYHLPKTLVQKRYERIEERLEKERARKERLAIKLQGLARDYYGLFLHEEHRLDKEIAVVEARRHFARTERLSVITGYIPAKQVDRLKRMLIEELDTSYELVLEDPIDAPVKLNHAKPAQSFTDILKMYTLPTYNELDPTILVALAFPIFFGFILGDVIYGLISLAAFTILKHKAESIKDFCTVLQLSAVSSIIFGIIYGEFMGFELHSAYYGWFPRGHHPEELLLYAVLFGLAHINLGLVLGAINDAKHSLTHALEHSIAWIILEIGAATLATGIYYGLHAATAAGALIGLGAATLLYRGHGVPGIIEIPGFFTSILSYARLMAVGLSSITIALLINEYSIPLFSQGILGIIAGLTLFSFGHILNILLGNFEGFVHTLRLHYVEFFTRFYKGGGQEFAAFGEKNYGSRNG